MPVTAGSNNGLLSAAGVGREPEAARPGQGARKFTQEPRAGDQRVQGGGAQAAQDDLPLGEGGRQVRATRCAEAALGVAAHGVLDVLAESMLSGLRERKMSARTHGRFTST
eukprot:6203281-Pleurochrysis_carterae.AAC.2